MPEPSLAQFPNAGLQVLSALIYLLGLPIITHFISRRVQYESLTFNGLKNMPWPRLCVILMFCDSWLFLLSSGILIFGIGLEYAKAVCTITIYLCIFFYSSAKFFVYAFLAEKVHIVWSPTAGVRRFESPVYLTCIVSVSFYCIVMTLMLGGPIHEFSSSGTCIIGLKPFGYIPLLVYDVYISFFLTSMFLFPLFRSKLMSSSVRRLATRTFFAAAISVMTSTANIVALMVNQGREMAWVNLGACAADIIVSAIAIFWVSGSRSNPQPSSNIHIEHRNYRHTANFGGGGPLISKSTTSNETTSLNHPNVSFPVHLEGDVENGLDSLKPANSWIHRLFERAKPASMPQLQIAVTKEFAGEHPQIELHDRQRHSIANENARKISVARS